jgi:hypothetical protein
MADTGWITCATGGNVAGIGTLAWLNTTRLTAEDASSATVTTNVNGSITQYAYGTNFAFGLPAGATILGIEARAKVATSNGGRTWTLSTVRLVKAGVVQTTNRGPGSTINFTTLAFQTFGGPADLWGGSWLVSDFAASNFGAAISATCNASQSTTVSCDVLQMRITYTPPAGSEALARPRLIRAHHSPNILGV